MNKNLKELIKLKKDGTLNFSFTTTMFHIVCVLEDFGSRLETIEDKLGLDDDEEF